MSHSGKVVMTYMEEEKKKDTIELQKQSETT